MLSYRNYYNDCYSVLYHHGVKGQKWGERRWQNEDGSLTPAGYEHYGYGYRLGDTMYVYEDDIQRRQHGIERRKKKDKEHKVSDFAHAVLEDEGNFYAGHGAAVGLLASMLASAACPPAIAAALPAMVVGGLAAGTYGEKKAKRELKEQGLYYVNSMLNNKPSSSRVTEKEESDFWKAYAAQQTSSASSGKKYNIVPTKRRTTYVVV